MNGRNEFAREGITRIRRLLRDKARASREQQKTVRARLRQLGFYITDFGWSGNAFTNEDLDQLIQANRIRIVG